MMLRAYYIFLVLLSVICFLPQTQGQTVTINYSDASGVTNDVVTIDVTVQGFTDITAFNFVTLWDETLLEFVSVSNQTSIIPAGEVFFGTPDITPNDDRVVVAFAQTSPVEYTLAPTDILFSLNLRILSTLNTTAVIDTFDGLPVNEFVIGLGGVKVKPGTNPGEVDLNPGGQASNVISIGDATGLPGGEVCIPISGADLTDLGGFNGLLLNWDPSVLTYTRTVNKTSPQGLPTINTNNAATGQLEMIYSYVGSGGIGLTSAATDLYCVCFDVTGDCDDTIPLNLQRGSNFGIFNSAGTSLMNDIEDGSFTVNCCDATAMLTNVTCPGGSDGAITLTPAGCANITDITWSNTTQTGTSITGLMAGTYDATITYDGGASTRVLTGYEITEPALIDVTSVDVTKVVSGNDGGVNIEVSGGTPGYTYSWSNGAVSQDLVNVGANSYSVTITDSRNCTASFGPYTVATAPEITGVVSNVMCAGTASGAVDITVQGGAPPYTYNWSCAGTVDANGDISGLTGGSCTVSVTDMNNCESTMTFNVMTPSSALVVSQGAVVGDVTNDGSGSIMLNVSGGWGNYQYDWSDGTSTTYPSINPLTGIFGGSYSVTVTDEGGCAIVLTGIEVSGLRVFASSIEPVACFGDNNGQINIGVLGGSGTYSYDWSCPDGTVDADGNISGLTSGSCTVTITDLVQNNSSVSTFVIPGPTEALEVSVDVTCSTNGNDGGLTANVLGGVAPYSYDWNTNPSQSTADVTNVADGSYTVLVTDSVGCAVMGMGSVMSCDEQDCYTGMDVITPNEDGKNDFFVIDCAGSSNNRLIIFTRWGQEVRTYNDYQNEWNGLDEGGNLVDEDTYLWVLEVYPSNGSTILYKGAVSVLYNLR